MNSCYGCVDIESCALTVFGSVAIDECPCRNCLIKGICKNPCKDFRQYQFTVFTPHRKPKIVKGEKK